jgi:hypothetical protein
MSLTSVAKVVKIVTDPTGPLHTAAWNAMTEGMKTEDSRVLRRIICYDDDTGVVEFSAGTVHDAFAFMLGKKPNYREAKASFRLPENNRESHDVYGQTADGSIGR